MKIQIKLSKLVSMNNMKEGLKSIIKDMEVKIREQRKTIYELEHLGKRQEIIIAHLTGENKALREQIKV